MKCYLIYLPQGGIMLYLTKWERRTREPRKHTSLLDSTWQKVEPSPKVGKTEAWYQLPSGRCKAASVPASEHWWRCTLCGEINISVIIMANAMERALKTKRRSTTGSSSYSVGHSVEMTPLHCRALHSQV